MWACRGCVGVLLVLCTLSSATVLNSTTEPQYSTVETAYGPVRGLIGPKVRHFLGIPYAHAPVGDLRWRSPVAPKPWGPTVRDALVYGKDCPQKDSDMHWDWSEDCLYINVFTPIRVDGKLPVMVFIHGGGYMEGGSSNPLYTGESVVPYANVVVVTFNYRIGSLGFLGSSLLRDRTTDGSYGNYGLQDQRMALQWVQRNIAAFGGDSGKMMIYGESAGGGSVACQLVAPKSAGLFQAAAMESGTYSFWLATRATTAESTFKNFVAVSPCKDTPDTEVVDCLLKLSPDQLLAAQANMNASSLETIVSWAPTVDGIEFTDMPETLAKDGYFSNSVPVIVGSNANEGATAVVALWPNMTETEYNQLLEGIFGDASGMILRNYPLSEYQSPTFAMDAIMTDFAFLCPSRRAARWTAKRGMPTYLYNFRHHPLNTPMPNCHNLPCHAAELPFVFHVDQLLMSPAEITLAQRMVSFWTNLAASGDPNGANLPNWPKFNLLNDLALLFQDNIESMKGLRSKQCNFWDIARIVGPTLDEDVVRTKLLQGLLDQ